MTIKTRDERLANLKEREEAKQAKVSAQVEAAQAKIKLEWSDLYKQYVELASKARDAETKEQQAEDAIINWMTEADVKTVEYNNNKITVKLNAPAVVVDDEWLIPGKFFTYKAVASLDKNALKSAIQEWLQIEWVSLVSKKTLVVTPQTTDDLPF